MSNGIILENFLKYIDSIEDCQYDFEQTIVLESTHYPYDVNDINTFDNFYVTIKDLKEHVINDNHEKMSFASIRKHKGVKYLSYFSQYYLYHRDDLIDMIETSVKENAENILNYITTTRESRYFFKQKFPRAIGSVYGEDRSGKTNVLGVIIGIDRKEQSIHLVSAFPVFEDYEPGK